MDAPALRIRHVPGIFPDKWFSRWRERFSIELDAGAFTADQEPNAMLAGADAALVRVAALPSQQRGAWYPVGPGIGIEQPSDDFHFLPLYTENAAVIFHKEDRLAGWAPDAEVPVEKLAEVNLIDWRDYPESVGGAPMGVEVVATGAAAAVVPFSLVRGHNHEDVRSRMIQLPEPDTNVPQDNAAEQVLWRTGLLWHRAGEEHPLLQDFIGILRGRSATSSRQPTVRAAEREAKKSKQRQSNKFRSRAQGGRAKNARRSRGRHR
ncbi:hypothetical protein [Micrococcoides hystricis]|uniref:LysR family transcriptional regulator n=1 Tax=Micrococcoides hystricis TaxID=1572761 RepID=A0ABV6PBM7_9MICC